MTFQVYLQNELPPEYLQASGLDWFDALQVKGMDWFNLCKFYNTCPAKFRFEERDGGNVTAIAEHAAILNPAEFERCFIREPAKEDYHDALTSDKDICAWLKDKGVAGYSGKKFDELMMLVERTGEKPLIWNHFIDEFRAGIGSKTAVRATDFDKILQMREIIFANKKFGGKLNDSFNDVIIMGEIDGVKIHVRYDAMTPVSEIIDYVGCTNASAEEFANQAIRGGYYLKQALLHDVFIQAYGKQPADQLFLAQEKSFPHVPMWHRVPQKMIEIGRMQYKTAIALYKQCIEKNVWPDYSLGHEVDDLPVPAYYARKYGLGDK